MPKILNLTQHPATPEQVSAGVFEPQDKSEVQRLLTFDDLPSSEEVWDRARKLAQIARREGATSAMIGGAPYLMAPLEEELVQGGSSVAPLYAFSVRKSVEKVVDGQTVKASVFVHIGFYRAQGTFMAKGDPVYWPTRWEATPEGVAFQTPG